MELYNYVDLHYLFAWIYGRIRHFSGFNYDLAVNCTQKCLMNLS